MIAVAVDILSSENAPYGSIAYWRAAASYFEHKAAFYDGDDEFMRLSVAARLLAGKAHVESLRPY